MGFRKMAGVSGIAFVVLLVASFVLYGSPPPTSATADEIAKYVVDTDTYLLAGVMGLLGALLMIPWVAGFVIPFTASDREHGEGFGLVIAGATLVASVAIGVALAALATLGLRIEELDGPTARALWDFSNAAYGFSILLVVPAAGGAAVATLKHGLMPRWFGYLSGVVGLLGLSALPGFMATGEAVMVLLLGLAGMLVWVLASSVLMLRGAAAPK